MFKGRVNDHGQATISGLLSFSQLRGGQRPEIAIEFVIDTGSDVTTLVDTDYEPYNYSDFPEPQEPASGYGGGLTVKKVPLHSLLFRLQSGGIGTVYLPTVDIIKPNADVAGLPSVIGRDFIDQYRLIIDKSVNLVVLQASAGPTP